VEAAARAQVKVLWQSFAITLQRGVMHKGFRVYQRGLGLYKGFRVYYIATRGDVHWV
jgi:hypothetical protein